MLIKLLCTVTFVMAPLFLQRDDSKRLGRLRVRGDGQEYNLAHGLVDTTSSRSGTVREARAAAALGANKIVNPVQIEIA